MELYHSSIVIADKPKIMVSDLYLDFGFGFYTTMNKNQAIKWTLKQKDRKQSSIGHVSSYDFDYINAQKDLKILNFESANNDWLDFVYLNRKGNYKEDYDIVIGPVADDGVYEVVRLYETGIFDLEETFKRLKVEELYNQVLFHTQKSLNYLKFIESEEI